MKLANLTRKYTFQGLHLIILILACEVDAEISGAVAEASEKEQLGFTTLKLAEAHAITAAAQCKDMQWSI